MSTYQLSYPSNPPTAADMKKEGYGVLHSFPFINDSPFRQLKDDPQPKKRAKLNHDSPSENTPNNAPNQIQVPPGVIHIRPTWKPVTLDEKPPFSYATMIAHAILSSQDRKLTLNEIYQWISEQYPCYSIKDHRWQNSIRHNLSLQKAFVKLDRDSDTPTGGKGCYWTILPGYEQQFIDNLMKHDKSITTTQTTTPNQTLIHNATNKKKPSHLFTIFRMTTKDNNDEQQQEKKQNTKRLRKRTQKQHYFDDSDCDSAVDVDIHYPQKLTSTPRLLQQQQEYLWQPQEDVLSNQDLMMFNPYIDQSLYLLTDNDTTNNYPQALIDPQPTSASTSTSPYYYDPTTIPFYNNTNNNTPSSTPTPTFINTCPNANDTFNPLFGTQPLYPSSNITPSTPIPSFESLPQQDLFYPY